MAHSSAHLAPAPVVAGMDKAYACAYLDFPLNAASLVHRVQTLIPSGLGGMLPPNLVDELLESRIKPVGEIHLNYTVGRLCLGRGHRFEYGVTDWIRMESGHYYYYYYYDYY